MSQRFLEKGEIPIVTEQPVPSTASNLSKKSEPGELIDETVGCWLANGGQCVVNEADVDNRCVKQQIQQP